MAGVSGAAGFVGSLGGGEFSVAALTPGWSSFQTFGMRYFESASVMGPKKRATSMRAKSIVSLKNKRGLSFLLRLATPEVEGLGREMTNRFPSRRLIQKWRMGTIQGIQPRSLHVNCQYISSG